MSSSSVTLVAAAMAALLSAGTLVASILMERHRWRVEAGRDTTRWVRESLLDVSVAYVQSSFAISGRSSSARTKRLAGIALDDVQPELTLAHGDRTVIQEELTKLRLLAPAGVVTAAERVHDSHHSLVNYALGRALPDDEAVWRELHDIARSDLLDLITALRLPLALTGDPAPIGAKARSSWTVPADEPEAPRRMLASELLASE
jgi:hypothetical protein